MNEKIIAAIQQHGARAVHEAAVKRLEGSHLALEAVGLFAVTLGDANEILSTAHKLMSSDAVMSMSHFSFGAPALKSRFSRFSGAGLISPMYEP